MKVDVLGFYLKKENGNSVYCHFVRLQESLVQVNMDGTSLLIQYKKYRTGVDIDYVVACIIDKPSKSISTRNFHSICNARKAVHHALSHVFRDTDLTDESYGRLLESVSSFLSLPPENQQASAV